MARLLHARAWRDYAADVISWIAFSAICCAMLLTVGDIAARGVSRLVYVTVGAHPGWGLFGLVDLTQLAMMTAMPLAIAAAFLADSHIRVDLVLMRLPPFAHRHAMRFAALVGAGLMGICAWTAWGELIGQFSFVTKSAALGIAYTWYWLPLIAGLALSVLGCLWSVIWPRYRAGSDV